MLPQLDRNLVVSLGTTEPTDSRAVAAPARSRTGVSAGMVASVVFHAGVALVLLGLVNMERPAPPKSFLTTPRLVRVVYLPSAPIEIAKLDLAELSAPKEVVAPEPAPVPETPAPVPVRPIETAVVESPIVRPAPVAAEVPKTPPPAPAPPSPTVGLFESTAAVRTPEPLRTVESAGFDLPAKPNAESRFGQASVGAFERAPAPSTRSATAVVADSGFGRSAPASAPSQPARVIRDTGFGTSTAAERPKSTAEVKPAGFADAAATEAPKRIVAAPAAPVTTPVEVLSKPTPIYTEQARSLKIEGDVVLEVDFSASGSLSIVRVVKGLGYGLDEAAIKAAEQIRFKPAMSHGRAVDYRANVHIVFRLA